jgi:cytochrome P450
LLRWYPALPLGLAHYTTENDEYRGYQIPKGTTVLPNVWAILHDPKLYPDPEVFIPDRFVDSEKNAAAGINERPEIAFGFGRR